MYHTTSDWRDRNPTLADVYETEKRRRAIDGLNQLYVALTRAERELYVISIASDGPEDKPLRRFPSILLPTGEYGTPYHMAEVHRRAVQTVIVSKHRTAAAPQPVASPESIGFYETLRGEFIHTVLAQIEYLPEGLRQFIRDRVADTQKRSTTSFNTDEESRTLEAFLSSPEVRPFFERREADETVLREQEFVSAAGSLYRMDRIVIGKERVLIVDFKTGRDDDQEKYREQVKNYADVLKDIYPHKTITGVLLYVDLRKAVEVV